MLMISGQSPVGNGYKNILIVQIDVCYVMWQCVTYGYGRLTPNVGLF